jgi:DNA-binding transcriptional ArsR family regulator
MDPVYRAISDPTRRAILDRLRQSDASAGDLAERFPVSRPAISRHLRVLREAALVVERREGRSRVYSLEATPLERIDHWVARYRLFWSARLHDLKDFVESEKKQDRE